MLRSGFQVQKTSGLLPLSHVCANLSHRYHVMDLLLDQTRSRARPRDPRGHQPAHPFDATCQQPKIPTPRFLHQSHRCFHVRLYRIRVSIADRVRAGQHRYGRHRRYREEKVHGHFQPHPRFAWTSCKERRGSKPRGNLIIRSLCSRDAPATLAKIKKRCS